LLSRDKDANEDLGVERALEEDKSPTRRERRKEHVPTHRKSSISHFPGGDKRWGLLQVLVGSYKTLVWNSKVQKICELGASEPPLDSIEYVNHISITHLLPIPISRRGAKLTLLVVTSREDWAAFLMQIVRTYEI
jgi:hypothetical protein